MSPTAHAPLDSTSAPPPNTIRYIIEPVTSESDIPTLAYISDIALKSDGFHAYRERYAPLNIYDDCFEKLTKALRNTRGQSFLFKVVLIPNSDDEEAEETIIGFSQWKLGYAEVPKVDPFAVKRKPVEDAGVEQSVSGVVLAEASVEGEQTRTETRPTKEEKPEPFYSDPFEESTRKLFNCHLSNIRGKRHLYLHRLIVHPSYQRQGIGKRLIEWGTEVADRENVVSWLFARPAGSELYKRNGWKVLDIIELDVPDLEVAPMLPMLRLPESRQA
ncbi:hypothetical protein LTR46_001543 [Exophiala xenobiotica]|nr:hypothetical protein LTR46_001543 [Exophiala xenobiotica]